MNSYILLRNNRESGPYTLKELRVCGLDASDLIWVEGESTSWQYAEEIAPLKAIAAKGIKIPLQVPEQTHSSTSSVDHISNYFDNNNNWSDDDSNTSSYYFKAPKKRRRISIHTNLFGLTVLLFGVMLCAFVIKKLVDSFDFEPSQPSEAVVIKEEILPLSNSTHSAKAPVTTNELVTAGAVIEKKDSADKTIVIKKISSPAIAENKEILKADNSASEQDVVTVTPVNKTDGENEVAEKELIANGNDKLEADKPVSRPPSVHISANDYKVGVFGGISGLELSIANPSTQSIEKAVVLVEFLKPNGSVIKSQTLQVENIAPKGSKKLSVPDNNRGVKVRYRIVSLT